MNRAAVVTWMRLVHAYHKGDRRLLAHLRCHGLSLAQFDVLAQLGAAEGITQQELADKLLVTKGNVTQLLDRMTQSGLLIRRQDGRANRLYLTDAGRVLFTQVIPAHEDKIAGMFAALSPAENRQLAALLRKLDHSLDKPPCNSESGGDLDAIAKPDDALPGGLCGEEA